MDNTTCDQCGATFQPSRSTQRFCCPTCSDRWHYAQSAGVFDCEYCGEKYHAKKADRAKYCSRDCAFADKKKKARGKAPKPGKPTIVCSICSKLFVANNKACVNCSDECRKESARRKAIIAAQYEKEGRACKNCGGMFTPAYGDKSRAFCGDACSNRYSRRQRKLKLKGTGINDKLNERARRKLRAYYGDTWAAHYEPINKGKVYERDNFICYLCQCKVEIAKEYTEAQATIDHVVPLALGGDHLYTNVKTACMKCNSAKGMGEAPTPNPFAISTDATR